MPGFLNNQKSRHSWLFKDLNFYLSELCVFCSLSSEPVHYRNNCHLESYQQRCGYFIVSYLLFSKMVAQKEAWTEKNGHRLEQCTRFLLIPGRILVLKLVVINLIDQCFVFHAFHKAIVIFGFKSGKSFCFWFVVFPQSYNWLLFGDRMQWDSSKWNSYLWNRRLSFPVRIPFDTSYATFAPVIQTHLTAEDISLLRLDNG